MEETKAIPTGRVCPISRRAFLDKAPPLKIDLGGNLFMATPRQFTTGSLGWNSNTKVQVIIDGVPMLCQVGLNVTVLGSKALPVD